MGSRGHLQLEVVRSTLFQEYQDPRGRGIPGISPLRYSGSTIRGAAADQMDLVEFGLGGMSTQTSRKTQMTPDFTVVYALPQNSVHVDRVKATHLPQFTTSKFFGLRLRFKA